jgi:hypothetical protein
VRHRTDTGQLLPTTRAPLPITRDRGGLLAALKVIDDEGWESPTATALLTYVRTEMVRPLTIDLGLRGAAASQAEASAWETVWLTMTKPSLRSAASPWGVLWQAARRAVLGEVLEAKFATNERKARRLEASARDAGFTSAASLEEMAERRLEPTSVGADPSVGIAWRTLLAAADAAMVDAGWDADDARRIVNAVLCMPTRPDARSTIVGWRLLAVELELPPWQARRIALALRGTTDAPGLLPLLATVGDAAARDPAIRHALRSTRDRAPQAPTAISAMANTSRQRDPQATAS